MTSDDIGRTIRKVRLERGLSQKDVRLRCGLCESVVSRMEAGYVSNWPQNILKVAGALRVRPFRFFMTDEEWRRWEGKA